MKATNLIKYFINLVPEAQPIIGKVPKYTTVKHTFANEIFPQMENAGIITQQSSSLGARTKFPLKKKGFLELRVVHNFITINCYTIKLQYLIHSLEKTLNVAI